MCMGACVRVYVRSRVRGCEGVRDLVYVCFDCISYSHIIAFTLFIFYRNIGRIVY